MKNMFVGRNIMKRYRTKSPWLILAMIAFLGISGVPTANAYEEVDVSNGGTISGRITMKGRRPEARVFALVNYPFGSFCKKISDGKGYVRLRDFIVSKDRGLWEAVVSVQKVKRGKAYLPKVAEFVAVDCMFHPADVADNEMFSIDEEGQLHHEHPNVSIIHNNQRMNMLNRDPVIHNIQVYQNEKGNIILNTPLPISTEPRGGVIHFRKGKHISQMICGMHEFMQSWGFVVNNPYHAKTAKDGSYKIEGLLPGTYTLDIWHPHFKIYRKEITVKANKTTNMDFVFDGNLVKAARYESQKTFRVDTATPEDTRLHEGEERIIMD
jgi:hypothetical protein